MFCQIHKRLLPSSIKRHSEWNHITTTKKYVALHYWTQDEWIVSYVAYLRVGLWRLGFQIKLQVKVGKSCSGMINNALVLLATLRGTRRLMTCMTPFVTLTYLLTFCKFFKIHQLPQACSSISTSSLLSLTFPCWFCWTLLKKFLISRSAWRTIGKRSSKFCTTRGAFFTDLESSNEKRCHVNKRNQYIYLPQ